MSTIPETAIQGQVELLLRCEIWRAKTKVQKAELELEAYKKIFPNEPNGEIAKLKEGIYNSTMEIFLNSYETACAMYFDGKLDKTRFRKEYRREIRDLIERSSLQKHFDANTSPYRELLKAYNEWEHS